MKRALSDFALGFFSPARALRYILGHPSLWLLALMPTLISFGLLAGLGVWAWHNAPELFTRLSEVLHLPTDDSQLDSLARAGLRVVVFLSMVVLRVMLLLTAAILAILLGKILAAPFNDALSEKVERVYTGSSQAGGWSFVALLRSGWWAITWEARKVVVYLILLAIMLTVNFLPFVGPPIYAAVVFLFNVLFLAFDYLDFPLERRPGPTGPLGFKARSSIVWRHLSAMLGFGLAATIILFVPLVNFLFLPMAVAGATLLYVDLEQREKAALEAR